MSFHTEPCRIDLSNFAPYSSLSRLTSEHWTMGLSYRVRFASYIRSGGAKYDGLADAPEQLRSCMLAVRAFDTHGVLLSYELVEGCDLEAAVGRLLADQAVQHLRVHYAALDRYAVRIERN